MTTTLRVCDWDLPSGFGAVALKDGHETVVHVSARLPAAVRASVASCLLQALHGEPYGGAEISFDAALDLPRQRGMEPIRL